MIPSFFGGRLSNVFDPFSLDVWDPFVSDGTVGNVPGADRETAALANV